MTPTFSVVLPCFNKEAEIQRCVNSVLSQSLSSFELIIVNDGSTDRSFEIASGIRDSRIRLFDQTNQGVASARNVGASMAIGEHIAYIDGDDEWLPKHLENLKSLIDRHPEAALFETAYWIDRGEGWRRRDRIGSSYLEKNTMLMRDYFTCPGGKALPTAMCVRRDALSVVGGYRQMFGEDVDLCMRLAAHFPVAYSRLPTAIWHLDAAHRRCVEKSNSQDSYQPGALCESLTLIAKSERKLLDGLERAKAFVARREYNAILTTIWAGDKDSARALYRWWCDQFRRKSTVIELWLRLPDAVCRGFGKVRGWSSRLIAAASYLLELRANRATFG